MTPVLLLLAGMICFGWSNCLWKPLSRRMNMGDILFHRSIWTVAILSAVFFITPLAGAGDWKSLYHSLRWIPWIGISFLGLLCFTHSLKDHPSGISGSLILYMVLFGSIVAHFFAGDQLPSHFGWILAMYICGLILLDPQFLQLRLPVRGTWLSLAAAACWAIANLGFKGGIMDSGPWAFSLTQELTVLLATGMMQFGQRISLPRFTSRLGTVFLISLLTIGGVVCCNLALGKLSVMQFTLISIAQPVATLFISNLYFKEELQAKQWFGGFLIISGSTLCAIG